MVSLCSASALHRGNLSVIESVYRVRYLFWKKSILKPRHWKEACHEASVPIKRHFKAFRSSLYSLTVSYLITPQSRAFAREEWFRGLDLEQGVPEASLILVARVGEVTETKLTLGGKVEQSLQQFKFEPLQALKGVFSREVLVLNSNDLGGYQFGNATRQIKTGQVRMLILGRSREGYTVQRMAPSLDQALPPLQDGNDPLIDAVS
jgi:hypothetical protein